MSKSSAYLQFILFSRVEQHGGWRREQTKELMRCFDNSNKVQHKVWKWNYYCSTFLTLIYIGVSSVLLYYIYLFISRLCVLTEQGGSKLVHKITYFLTLWVSAPKELQFSIIYLHWHVTNQGTNKTVPTIFFFSNFFWINWAELFSCKTRF